VIARVLDAAGIQALAHPGWLLLLVPLVFAALAALLRTSAPALEWPHIAEARQAGARRIDLVWLGSVVLRAGALVALALVLAGPVGVHRAPPEPGYGLDMSLVLDVSGSMRALDARVGDEWRTRLDLAREVVARFATRRAQEGDRVALVVFGETSMTQCPLTSDGALLAAALRRVEVGMVGEATALGDALALAVKRATGAGESLPGAGGPVAGRLVVLLTDGRHNAGSFSLEAATSLAAGAGVRVHTVAIGSAGEAVPMEGPGGDLHFERHDIDTEALAAIARATGGRFFVADRSADLEEVYREIDTLERVARRLPPRVRHVERPEPFLALAGVLLLGEITVGRVLRRRLP
jgi:Ca-activated chloride channel family protein